MFTMNHRRASRNEQGFAAAIKGAVQVKIDIAVPLIGRHFADFAEGARAGLVDQDIESPEFVDGIKSELTCESATSAVPKTRPSVFMAVTARSRDSWVRPQMATVAPSLKRRSAMARPMPRVPPVTIAILPFRGVHGGILSRGERLLRRVSAADQRRSTQMEDSTEVIAGLN